MGIAALLLGSMYSVFTFSQKTFKVQEQIAEAQQNARAAIQLMSRDIIMAGYSTPTAPGTGIKVANKAYLTVRSAGIDVSYSFYSSNKIGRTMEGTRQAVTEGVRSLSFMYYDGSGGNQGDASGNVANSNLVNIKQISISVGTPAYNNYSGSLETNLTPRNLR
jgi:type II secretory pathway component PulJ